MTRENTPPSLKNKITGRRRGVSLESGPPVHEGRLSTNESLPLVLRAEAPDVGLLSWIDGRRDELSQRLIEEGGLLFRGFQIGDVEGFEKIVAALSDEVLDYTYRSTPRSEVQGKVYTSTEYPADQSIPMHNEMSYTRTWPRKIWFCSVKVAEKGGETPIADSRKVYGELDAELRRKFEEVGVLYVRNYGSGLDLPWQDVFQTDDRKAVEAYCQRAGIEYEWHGDQLQTRQICQATAEHPVTGEKIWFNQAHLFHVSSLDPALREFLVAEFGEEGLPRNSYYGDQTPIEDGVLEAIRAAYRKHLVVFPWQQADLLMLDNMLVAHGRKPYEGSRKVVVAMAEAWSAEQS